MSLYLKYRPKSFADVVGQEHIVTTLEHAVNKDQLVHAYLFYGPRGTGKTSVARILAKILLIRGIEDEAVQKQVVEAVDQGTLTDLIEIDAASNRGIDDVRDLKEKVQFRPTMASAKVYIVDEVHMMTKEAFNALLKTLEEPPEHAFFILATTELHKVPDTIQSRCQRFPFRQINDDDIVRCLQNIADKERITVDRPALRAIARHVNGGMRDGVSLLDQLSSLEKITEEDVRLRIGESAEEYVEDLWSLLDSGDRLAALDLVSELQEKGVSLEVFLRQLLAKARSELHSQIEAKTDTSETLTRIDAIFQALSDLRVSPVPSVAVEVAVVGMCGSAGILPASGKSKEKEVERRGEKKEKGEKKTPEAPGATDRHPSRGAVGAEKKDSDSSENASASQADAATFEAEELSLESLKKSWNQIMADVPTAAIRMSLKDAVIEDVTDLTVRLAFSSGFHREKIQDKKAMHELEAVLKNQFKQLVTVECVLQEESGERSATSGEQEGGEVNMVEAVAEIFGK